MGVTLIDQREAEASIRHAQRTANETKTSFFDFCGTANCRLNCAVHQNYQHKSRTDHSERAPRAQRVAARRDYDESLSEWFTATEITDSASQGCGSCSALISILQHAFGSEDSKLSESFRYSYARNLKLRRHPLHGEGSDELGEVVQVFQPLESTISDIQKSKFLSGATSSIERLRSWIDNCIDNHESCQMNGDTQEDDSRPTRLLDLNPIFRSGKTGTRLVKTESGVTYQYACLSHRWDQLVENCRTVDANVDQHMEFVPDDRLPTNFLDAITIARELSLRYLWIDSLCIIQGGLDLDRELAKMGNIYSNAYLTIAAVSSSSSSGGCLRRGVSPDIPLLLQNKANERYVLGIRVLDRKGKPPTKKDVPYRHPLLQRAWVFQERLLSRRFLQCNYGEFTYECSGWSGCECNSFLAPHPAERIRSKSDFSHQWRSSMQIPFKSEKLHGNENPPNDRKQIVLADWRSIVKAYMYLQITYPLDVLPAISACAQAYSHRFGLTYVAGMWRERLSNDLLWYVRPLVAAQRKKKSTVKTDRPQSPTNQPARPQARPSDLKQDLEKNKTTAPSWSWASVAMGQAIDMFSTEGSYALLKDTVKEILCEPMSRTNPFGRLKFAYLRLDTILYPWYLRAFCPLAIRDITRERRRVSMDLYVGRGKQLRKQQDTSCTTNIEPLDIGDASVTIFYDAPIIRNEIEMEEFDYCACRPPYSCRLAQIFLLPALQQTGADTLLDAFLLLIKTVGSSDRLNCYKSIGLVVVNRKSPREFTWEEMTAGTITPRKEEMWLV